MYVYIRSMSEPQSKVYDKITAVSSQILQHLIRLIIYSNTTYEDHWKHEIWAMLHEVPKLKGKNKFPTSKFIFSCLEIYNDALDAQLRLTKSMESELTPSDISSKEILNKVINYQKWLAKMLSDEGTVTFNEVNDAIDSILK